MPLKNSEIDQYLENPTLFAKKNLPPSLSQNEQIEIFDVVFSNIQDLNNDSHLIYLSLRFVKHVLHVGAIAISHVLKSGVMDSIFQLIKGDDSKIILEILRLFDTIVGVNGYTGTVLDMDNSFIPIIIDLATKKRQNSLINQFSFSLLANLAGEGFSFRDILLSYDLFDHLTSFTKLPSVLNDKKLMNDLSFLAQNLLRNFSKRHPMEFRKYKSFALPLVKSLLQYDDLEIVKDALWSISYIQESDENSYQIDVLLSEPTLLARLMELVTTNSENLGILTPCLRCIANMVIGDDEQTEYVVKASLIPLLSRLLQRSQNVRVNKECLWTLSNVLCGTVGQIEEVINHELFPIVFKHLKFCDENDEIVRLEACYCVANVFRNGSAQQKKRVLGYYDEKNRSFAIHRLCENIMKTRRYPKIILVALEGLEAIVKVNEEEEDVEEMNHVDSAACADEMYNGSRKNVYIIKEVLKEEGIVEKLRKLKTMSKKRKIQKISRKICDLCMIC